MQIWRRWHYLFFISGLILWGAPPVLGQSAGLFNKLAETSKAEIAQKGGGLHVATEWKKREGRSILKAFRSDFPFVKKVSFTRARGVATMQRILLEAQQGGIPKYDVLKVSSEAWPDYRKAGLFVKPPFDYRKLAHSLPSNWGPIDPRVLDPEGYFVSTTSYTHGIAYNGEMMPSDKVPKEWDDCLNPMWRGKLLYDPRPKLYAFYHDPKTREGHVKWLKGIVKNKAVLNRGQTENLMKVSAGEYPLVCGVQYNSTARLIDKGAPLNFVLAEPISVKLATELYVVKWSKTPVTTQLLALWLATKGQREVDKSGYRGFPWSQETRLYPMAKGKYAAVCDAECALRTGQDYQKLHADILGLPGVR